MKVILALVLFFTAVPGFPVTLLPTIPASDAVFNLMVDGQAICTAFAVEGVRREHVLITAGHCATDLAGHKVVASNKARSLSIQVELYAVQKRWPDADYAIFHYTNPSEVPEAALRLASAPELGDAISTIEAPLGMTPFLAKGIYSGRADCADTPVCAITGMYLIQVPATHGASGSPVLDKDGRVWGILVGSSDELKGMAVVVLVPQV